MPAPLSTYRTDLLFVYGTLRRAARNPFANQLHRTSTFVGDATLPGRLYRVSWYPAAVHDPTADTFVAGEVFRLHDPARLLADLDDYEDVPSGLYVRQALPVTLLGQTLTAWVYLYNQPTAGLPRIVLGDFYG